MISLQRLVQKIWTRQGVLGVLGWLVAVPFSLLFSAVVRVRNFLYERGVLHSEQLPLHIISVGNLTVGGTGKDALRSLARSLAVRSASPGRHSLKRLQGEEYRSHNSGYGRSRPSNAGGGWRRSCDAGQNLSGVVLAARGRVRAARLAQETYGAEVLILDDGFQYRRLGRSLDILLLNAQQRETWLLPAGPFREPFTSIHRADLVVVTKGRRCGLSRTTRPPFTYRSPPLFCESTSGCACALYAWRVCKSCPYSYWHIRRLWWLAVLPLQICSTVLSEKQTQKL